MTEERKKISPEQLNMLVNEILNDKLLSAMRGRNKTRNTLYKQKWDILTNKLNALENGAQRSVSKWQQTWRDFKSNTKKKANRGPSSELSELELQVLRMDNFSQVREGIDIRSILEVDPLSSDEDPSDHDSLVTPDMVTVYSNNENRGNVKRSNSDNENGNIKRQRIHLFPDANLAQQTATALSSLVALETSRKEADDRNAKLLEDIRTNVIRCNTILEQQLEVFNKVLALLIERANVR